MRSETLKFGGTQLQGQNAYNAGFWVGFRYALVIILCFYSVCRWCHPIQFLKTFGKIREIIKAYAIGNLCNTIHFLGK